MDVRLAGARWVSSRWLSAARAAVAYPLQPLLSYCALALQFPKSAFELAESLAVGFNELVDAIARDPAWLKATLAA